MFTNKAIRNHSIDKYQPEANDALCIDLYQCISK